MVDDLKSLKDNLFKVLASRAQPDDDDDETDDTNTEGSFIDSGAARAIISTLFAKAGKSKDEVIQILAREIGMAVAGMLKNQKLQITFEFVNKKGHTAESKKPTEEKSSTRPRAHKSSPKAKQKK
jgi:hypothetical protein